MLVTDNIKSQLEWLSTLQVPPAEPHNLNTRFLRKTSIIATIGPKTNSVEMLTKLRGSGVNVVRMNFSHGSYEYHQSVIDNTRSAVKADPEGRPLAIALDTKGPEIRTGKMVDMTDVPIAAGHKMIFSTDTQYAAACTDKVMFVDYKNMPKVLSKGKIIYVDDGILAFTVIDVQGEDIHVQAFNNGILSSYKGVNLPGTEVDLPALSEKDKADLDFGVKNGVDMIFASFIRRGEDVKHIRQHLGEAGANIKIISKIENLQGVQNFDEILKETDGVMVARGDLGIEIPASQVFMAQKMMIAKCQLAGKPSICATQMLESMTVSLYPLCALLSDQSNPRPTRAEVSDVANAVLDGADCVMLSGETAKGIYPLLAVEMMSEVCYLAESTICYPPLFNEMRALTPRPTDTTETVAMAAVAAAHEQNAGAIIVMSTGGNTARLISKYRPQCPILMITRTERTSRQIHLHRGCYPFFYDAPRPESDEEWQKDVDARLVFGLRRAIKLNVVDPGATIIAVQGWRKGGSNTNTMRVLTADVLPEVTNSKLF